MLGSAYCAHSQSPVTSFSPAKINLFLAITGRRPDGFHNLVSVVTPLQFGDELGFLSGQDGDGFSLECDTPEVPLDASNLILRAATAFAQAAGKALGGRFILRKRIPMGAGLGGGSSNASTALKLLDRTWPGLVSADQLVAIATSLGSDCPLFLRSKPVIMRGRGERVEDLPAGAASRLSGTRLLLFKPSFGISTPWAYGRMAAEAPAHYLPEAQAEARLSSWLSCPSAPLAELLFNNMEGVAFRKYIAMPVVLDQLRHDFGLAPRMSGSGSCCFAPMPEDFDATPVVACIHEAWGSGAFVQETRIA